MGNMTENEEKPVEKEEEVEEEEEEQVEEENMEQQTELGEEIEEKNMKEQDQTGFSFLLALLMPLTIIVLFYVIIVSIDEELLGEGENILKEQRRIIIQMMGQVEKEVQKFLASL